MSKQSFTSGQVLTAAQMNTLQTNDYNWSIYAKTSSYVLAASDAGTRITMNSATATTVTINTATMTAGDVVHLLNIGAGVCTVTAGPGTTVVSAGLLGLTQYASGYLFAQSSTTFYFIADGIDATSMMAWNIPIGVERSFANTNWSNLVLNASGDLAYTNSTGAQNAYIEWKVPIAAGTWTFGMLHYKGADRGIYTVALDGVTAGTVDGYNATSAAASNTITAISVATTGVKALRLTMATKNASSSSYAGYLNTITLQRTA